MRDPLRSLPAVPEHRDERATYHGGTVPDSRRRYLTRGCRNPARSCRARTLGPARLRARPALRPLRSTGRGRAPAGRYGGRRNSLSIVIAYILEDRAASCKWLAIVVARYLATPCGHPICHNSRPIQHIPSRSSIEPWRPTPNSRVSSERGRRDGRYEMWHPASASRAPPSFAPSRIVCVVRSMRSARIGVNSCQSSPL